jgi:hypothetical protein
MLVGEFDARLGLINGGFVKPGRLRTLLARFRRSFSRRSGLTAHPNWLNGLIKSRCVTAAFLVRPVTIRRSHSFRRYLHIEAVFVFDDRLDH